MRGLLIVFLICVLPAYSQKSSVPLMFQTITTDQGLPHNYVHSVTQDHKGFIWIGTNYGLARYDGYNFKVYSPDSQKKNYITHKAVGTLFVDSKDRLWFGLNSGGINKMDISTEHFTGYFYESSGKSHIGFYVRMFYEDSDSVIWLVSDRGLFRYNPDVDAMEDVLNDISHGLDGLDINTMTDDKCGNLWFIFNEGLYVLNKKTLKISNFKTFTGFSGSSEAKVHAVYCSEKGKVWVGTVNDGLLCYNLGNKQFDRYLKNITFIGGVYADKKGNVYAVVNNPSYKLLVCKKEDIEKGDFNEFDIFPSLFLNRNVKFVEDDMGNVWIASTAGLCRYSFENGLTDYQSNAMSKYAIATTNIEDVYIDRTQNLWVTPYRRGIYKVDLCQKLFQTLDFSDKWIDNAEYDRNVFSVLVDSKDRLWFGESNSGVSCLDRKSGRYYRFYLDTPDPVISICEDVDGYYWFGNYYDVLMRVKIPDLSTLPVDKVIHLTNVERFNWIGVRKIVRDNTNNIWFATNTGLVEWERKSNKFINHSQLYDSLNVVSAFYRTIYIDENHIIWTGSNSGGLTRYDKAKHEFKHYMHDPNNPQGVMNNTVYDIEKDREGQLLIGTGQGLVKFDVDNESFKNVLNDKELKLRSIFSVCGDASGGYWMSADNGIIHYDSRLNKSIVYGSSDGLTKNEFNTTASFFTPQGEVFYGGTGGLVTFNPSNIKANTVMAKPAITSFKFFNTVVSPGDTLNGRVLMADQIWNVNQIDLAYNENDFSLEFSALHYSAPEKIKYQYRLIGFHDQWIEQDATRRWATFTGLPPGDYTFELRATNNDGLMCRPEDEVKLVIIIHPPFWQTLWFKALILIMLVLCVFLIIRLRVRHLSNQKHYLEKMVEERTAELADSNILLEERQEEIAAQNEELARTNKLLEERQEEIKTQNEELVFHRDHLERLVADKIIDLEMALKKAEESDRLKTAFLANLSHEIRTPMNAIIGFSNLLNSATTDDERDGFITIINNNCESLLVLINDIIDISLIEANQVTIRKEPFNVVPLLHEIESNFKLNLHKNIDVIFEGRDNELVMDSDSFRLRQIINNLIVNAVKFTDQGSIRFGYVLEGAYAKFYVKDTGVGIAEADFERIFDHFHKKELIEGRIYRGTGIGLSICKSLVQLLGGTIGVESEVGKGSLFYFTIPLI
jgi:signal transduction histidine kinase/ligand-binding sensor domain-containing protein